jgi:hypothetical protein
LPADSRFMTPSTQNTGQDDEIPRLLGWRGGVAIISGAAVTLSIAQLRLSTATIMVSICAIPLLVLAMERGNALLASAARRYEPERAAPTLTVRAKAPTFTERAKDRSLAVRAKAPTLGARAKAPTLRISRRASPGLPRVRPGQQHGPRGSRRVASRV